MVRSATLEKLQALAPPNVIVKEGGCSSACGNGPIVLCPESKSSKKSFRKIAGPKKILELLLESANCTPPLNLVQAYDLALEADEAFAANSFQVALDLYIQVSFELDAVPIVRESSSSNDTWLVRAKRNQAMALLRLGDSTKALVAAKEACDLADNTCASSYQVKATVYRELNDAKGELESLRSMFAVPVGDDSNLSFSAKNERRELGFRMAKLERDAR